MLKLSLTGLALSAALAGCADDASDVECLPGDIDCADASAGGKADEWNGGNDPRNLSQRLNYRLVELPREGRLDTPVWRDRYPNAAAGAPTAWTDSYWPSAELSSNARWRGHSVESPLELADRAFNNHQGCASRPTELCGDGAKAAWDQYLTCAGPAAKWHTENFHGMRDMFDGVDNDNDGTKDECDRNDDEGPQGWWGLCHAWAPAALLEPEPKHPVTVNGVTFTPGDIKALIQTVYDRTSALMLGGRCNSKEIEGDPGHNANDECRDTNAGSLHVILTNMIGINDAALIADTSANYEVWNYPVLAYRVTKQERVGGQRAMACVGGSGTRYTYNTRATRLFEVEVDVDFLGGASASTRPQGWQGHTFTNRYHYILETREGKIIGGRYCTDSQGEQPDFLWSPTGVSTSSWGRNPHVDLARVRDLINRSQHAPGTAGNGGSTTGSARSFSATPDLVIPDNAPAGVTSDIAVRDVASATSVAVSVDIEHSYRGDLRVELLKDGRSIKVLHDRAGGSADHLVQTFTLAASELGSAPNGTYTLKVVDTAADDVGRLKSWKLDF